MQGVLYVSHGSRYATTKSEVNQFIADVKEEIPIHLQEICYLELADPDIHQGINNLVLQGATAIAVIPVLLLRAGHYYQDIPEIINQQKAMYPHVSFSYGQPLGVQNRLTSILAERIKETNRPIDPNAKVFVVGRGSSNPQTKKDMEAIADRLQAFIGVDQVEACYLAACDPSFETMLEKAVAGESAQIIIVPYIWFTGFLTRFMNEKVAELDNHGKEILLCKHLGAHVAMKQALRDRVIEAVS
ncbi:MULTISPECIES: sirohydrochlorin chelatase [Virgibacillus]|uniref:Cobalamin biosynthesis protein CbiX n=1 Tax=Virgibacillus kapii TaxID=1638645 RepID=A0ABQ2DHX8_9BACI|nr:MULTISPECIES: sirohydrochlorin chelatase [Virgibacillus]EQB38591.1 hypothetical protein M948_08370 [Virgibacillus sp. CM-4]MYL41304.1 sirohydrochlorin chelatase [Virgibacillus massiliensis]GGJ55991.1 cobalamin biosynthesis protein CbiX [Virgibacillus kapii]